MITTISRNQLAVFIIAICVGPSLHAQSTRLRPGVNEVKQAAGSSQNYQLTHAELDALPDIGDFQESPSPQFLIDWKDLRTGEPYLGVNTDRPHTGCHLYFQRPSLNLDASKPETYPPIYAVSDGIVTRLDYAFRLRPVFMAEQGKEVSNVRYGIDLTIARNGNEPVAFHYSIEPMTDPGDEQFYRPFLLVKPGEKVKRGQSIACMYLPPDSREVSASHIHFNLIANRQFQSPSIFDKEVAGKFQTTWGDSRDRSNQKRPAFFGFGLNALENPFGTGAKDQL